MVGGLTGFGLPREKGNDRSRLNGAGGMGDASGTGVLRCAQDDSKNKQRQGRKQTATGVLEESPTTAHNPERTDSMSCLLLVSLVETQCPQGGCSSRRF